MASPGETVKTVELNAEKFFATAKQVIETTHKVEASLKGVKDLVGKWTGISDGKALAGLAIKMVKGAAGAEDLQRITAVFDNGTRAARIFGNALLRITLPAFDAVSAAIGKLVTSGRVEAVAHAFESLFNPDLIAKSARQFVNTIADLIEKIPGLIKERKGDLGRMFESALSAMRNMVPVLRTIAGVAETLAHTFAQLPQGLQTAVMTLGLLNKGTGGLLGNLAGGFLKKKDDPGLAGLLAAAITGPIGMIGAVLITGAADMASKMSDAIKELEGIQQDKANVPHTKSDPTTHRAAVDAKGHPIVLTPEEAEEEEKRQRRIRHRKEVYARFGIDFGEEEDKVTHAATPAPDPDPNSSEPVPPPPVISHIERQTRALETLVDYKRRPMDVQGTMMGGGELGRVGVSAVEFLGHSSVKNAKLEQAVRLIAEYAGGLVSDRQVSDARHHGRYQGAF